MAASLSAPAATQQGSSRIGPSGGAVAGAAAGAGVAIAVVVVLIVSRSHHVMTGCVVSSSGGLELQTSDSKAFMLEGELTNLKAGNRVKIRGSRARKGAATTSHDVFIVEKVSKDYGGCRPEHTSTPGVQ
jgi:hypothetical protein